MVLRASFPLHTNSGTIYTWRSRVSMIFVEMNYATFLY